MSFKGSSLEFETSIGIYVPKRTIYSFVQEIAPKLIRVNKATDEFGIVVVD